MPPPVIHFVLAGLTPEAESQFLQLFAQVNAAEQEQFKTLLQQVEDNSQSPAERLDKAEKLVSLVQNSQALALSLIAPHAPQALSILSHLFNR